jgi:hypothetical protein
VGRLDRRTLERLESKYPKVRVGHNRTWSDSLEEYFMELENYQLEQQGLPKVHDILERPDPLLEEYFAQLDKQVAERDVALSKARREHS